MVQEIIDVKIVRVRCREITIINICDEKRYNSFFVKVVKQQQIEGVYKTSRHWKAGFLTKENVATLQQQQEGNKFSNANESWTVGIIEKKRSERLEKWCTPKNDNSEMNRYRITSKETLKRGAQKRRIWRMITETS